MDSNIGKSKAVYLLNSLIVVFCLVVLTYVVLQENIDKSVIAVISGTVGTIAGSIITIMLKSAGAEDVKNPMENINEKLIDLLKSDHNQQMGMVIDKENVSINKGNNKVEIKK